MISSWKKLCEIFKIKEAKPNWDRARTNRAIATHGTQSSRSRPGPMPYFNPAGTGAAQAQNKPVSMTPKPGGLQIPSGQDKPGQLNPLYGIPPQQKTTSGLSKSPNGIALTTDVNDEDEWEDYENKSKYGLQTMTIKT